MYELDFLPVGTGNGDAICLRYGEPESGYYVHVVDGGFKTTAQTIISHIENCYGHEYFINNMVVSHADNDHAAGLVDVFKRFHVERLYMNRPWLYVDEIMHHFHGNFTRSGLIDAIKQRHSALAELEKLALQRETPIFEAFQGTRIGPFTVLAPSRARYIELLPDMDKTPTSYTAAVDAYGRGLVSGLFEKAKKWFDENWNIETLSNNPEPCSASNEACVVQYGEINGSRILLTADVGPAGLNEAANYADQIGMIKPPNVVQVPHHGSRRNVTPNILDCWLGHKMGHGETYGLAYCSVGDDKPDYPRSQVQNAFERRGYPVFVTRGMTKYVYQGVSLRNGWSIAQPEPFAYRVEG